MKKNNDLIYSILGALDATANVKQFQEISRLLDQSTIPISDAKVLVEALVNAEQQLSYCGYGDRWEREGTEGLQKQLATAIALAKQLNLTTEKGG